MYLRVLNFKFPNELAKKSVIALTRNTTQDQFKNVFNQANRGFGAVLPTAGELFVCLRFGNVIFTLEINYFNDLREVEWKISDLL